MQKSKIFKAARHTLLSQNVMNVYDAACYWSPLVCQIYSCPGNGTRKIFRDIKSMITINHDNGQEYMNYIYANWNTCKADSWYNQTFGNF